jgi:putative endopeptidase
MIADRSGRATNVETTLLPEDEAMAPDTRLSGSLLFVVATIAIKLMSCLPCANASPQKLASHLDITVMDTTTDPCQDFYRYACGNYTARHPLLAGQDYIFLTDLQRRDAIADLATYLTTHDGRDGGDNQVRALHDYYTACIAGESDASTAQALHPLLAAISQYHRRSQLPLLLAQMARAGAAPFFRTSVDSEAGTSQARIVDILPPQLSLSDAEDYRDNASEQEASRDELRRRIKCILTRLGQSRHSAATGAIAVIGLERMLAKAARTPLQERDPRLHLNPRTATALAREAAGFDWSVFLAALGVRPDSTINVDAPQQLAAFATAIDSLPPSAVRAYLRYKLLISIPPVLQPSRFAPVTQRHSQIAGHDEAVTPRTSSCLLLTARARQDDVTRLYIRQFFSPTLKAAAEKLVAQIKHQFAIEIQAADWLDVSTRARAAEKLSNVADVIAYDDLRHNYDDAPVYDHQPLQDYFTATKFNLERSLDTIGKPAQRNISRFLPIATGARYDGEVNAIEVPAVEWTPPSFDPEGSAAENFGRVGFTVGHELIHGFDDKGRQRDALGRIADWWTEADAERFHTKAQCFVHEYEQFGIDAEHHEDGQLTLGENIADNGGLHLAMLAFLAYAKENGIDPMAVESDGWSSLQRFFLAYSQETCSAVRTESELRQMKINPHSLDRFRANGIMRNLPEFSQAFACRSDAAMTPRARCAIW